MSSTPPANRSLPAEELANRVRGCRDCPDLVRCRRAPVPGVGPVPAPLMLVGLAPGRLGGDRTGLPFAGDASGRRLRAALGSQVRRVYITNVVKCAPKACAVKNSGTDLPTVAFEDGLCRIVQTACMAVNRPPAAAEIGRCRRHLVDELAAVRPIGVVALGRLAERAVQQALGRPVRPGRIGTVAGEAPYLAFLPHPASFLYHPDWEDAFLGHLRRLARAAGLPLG